MKYSEIIKNASPAALAKAAGKAQTNSTKIKNSLLKSAIELEEIIESLPADSGRAWTEEEKELLLSGAPIKELREKLPHRTQDAIYRKRWILKGK